MSFMSPILSMRRSIRKLPERKFARFMLDKLQWLEKPVNVDSMVDQGYLPR